MRCSCSNGSCNPEDFISTCHADGRPGEDRVVKRKRRELKENDNTQEIRGTAHQVDVGLMGVCIRTVAVHRMLPISLAFCKKIPLEEPVLGRVPRHYADVGVQEYRYVFLLIFSY